MTMPVSAERVRKARAESICRKRQIPHRVGVRIGKVPGVGWCDVTPRITGGRQRRTRRSPTLRRSGG